jgi:SAM-dependent methyltransferase
MTCKLCRNDDLRRCGTVSAEDIVAIYSQDLGVDLPAVDGSPPAAGYAMLQCLDCGLKQFSPDWIGGPGLYRALQYRHWYYPADRAEFSIAATRVRPGDAVLEVGCGSGRFARFLPQPVRYVGLDTNTGAVARAQASGLDVRVQELAEFANGNQGGFNMVCAFQVLEHLPDPTTFLGTLASLLRSGGLAVISVPADDSFVGGELNNVLNLPPHHATRWPDQALARLGSCCGLETVELVHEPLDPAHVRGAAMASLWRLMADGQRRGAGLLLTRARSRALRRAVAIASLPLRAWMHLGRAGYRGHTTTLVLRQP